jgi:hypothetical protein
VTGRFSRSDGRGFRDRCREAIGAERLDQQIFDAWVVAHDRRRVNIKKGTISSTRTRILEAEATAYAALLAALPQQCRIEAKVTETLAVSSDTNERVQRLEEQLVSVSSMIGDLHTVQIRGEALPGADSRAVIAQSRAMKNPWTTRVEVARATLKEQKMQEARDRTTELEELVDRRKLAHDELKKSKAAPKAKAAAKRASTRAKAKAKAEPQQSTLDAGFDVD